MLPNNFVIVSSGCVGLRIYVMNQFALTANFFLGEFGTNIRTPGMGITRR